MNSQKTKEFYDQFSKIESLKDRREFIVKNYFKPMAFKMLELDENINSVTVALSQYWNDEANNAVHVKFIPSSENFSTWEHLFNREVNKTIKDSEFEEESVYFYYESRNAEEKLFGGPYSGPYLDNDEYFIETFEMFCKEGCNQEMDQIDTHSPYLIFNRKENGEIVVRELGEMVRVWS